MLRRAAALSTSEQRPRYLEPLAPVVFPEEAELPETQLHLDLRTLLYQLLSDYLGLDATVGSEQFVYFDAADPKRVLAPDVFVRLEPRGERIRSWKTWERGAPEVAVEIISESDSGDAQWSQKLRAYRSMGVRELVRFEPDAPSATCLRVWDQIDGGLIERAISGASAPSSALPLHWVVAGADEVPLALRIADEGGALVPTHLEARRTEDEGRKAAEARLLELEAEMRRLKGGA
ncbi:MAG TPA: Uma2 family endonuclease, partial [Polyangiaceae bacterium]